MVGGGPALAGAQLQAHRQALVVAASFAAGSVLRINGAGVCVVDAVPAVAAGGGVLGGAPKK